jgi:hypothetical protein
MTTVSPAAAKRTYSLSLFFRIFRPTVRTHDHVAPGSHFIKRKRARTRSRGNSIRRCRCIIAASGPTRR